MKMATSDTTAAVVASGGNSDHLSSDIDGHTTKAFVIDFTSQTKAKNSNLQDAFKKYKKKRQREIKRARKRKDVPNEVRMRAMADPDRMWNLRMKFLDQVKKYFGVPYAKKYWTPEDSEYHSPLFLDCCGLVRRVMRDLRRDFGFSMGQWNQSYQFDTLPLSVSEEDMKPGDLVFISATYYNKKSKKQKHNMTHVEVWLGDGPKTIGARWQKGKVQVFDSYKFVSKSYHSETYHFKSIDTWLMGICRSHCGTHEWRTRSDKFSPTKKSIFSQADKGRGQGSTQGESALVAVDEDESAGDTDEEEVVSEGLRNKSTASVPFATDINSSISNDERKYLSRDLEQMNLSSPSNKIISHPQAAEAEGDTSRLSLIPDDCVHSSMRGEVKDSGGLVREHTASPVRRVPPAEGFMAADAEAGVDPDFLALGQCTSEVDEGGDDSDDCCVGNVNGNNNKEMKESGSESAATHPPPHATTAALVSSAMAVAPTSATEPSPEADAADDLSPAPKEEILSGAIDESAPDITVKASPVTAVDSPPVATEVTTDANTGQKNSIPPSIPPPPHTQFPTKGDKSQKTQKQQDKKADTVGQRNNDKKPPDTESGGKKTNDLSTEKMGRIREKLTGPKEPTFYIGGGNGVSLIEEPLLDLGWKRVHDKANETFKLKWVETKNNINYGAFKVGDQMVNRIPNCSLLTNKLGLLNSLQRFDRVSNSLVQNRTKLRLSDIMPETYHVDDPYDRRAFLDVYQPGEIWICKPTGMNQGKGIYLVRDIEEFQKNLDERDERSKSSRRHPSMERIVQRYIEKPLLLEGRKFDVRAYMLIANTVPFVVLFHSGYVRLCLHEYKLDSSNLTAHLTNQFIQKKDSSYQDAKEESVWSMERFNDYINLEVADQHGLEANWVFTTFTSRMKQIMLYCFNAVKHKLTCQVGFFDLYGLDFMVDENMKISLIEINCNPALASNCQVLREVIPPLVRETLYLSLECFEKARKNRPIFPLDNLHDFEVIHKGGTKCHPAKEPPQRAFSHDTSPELINSQRHPLRSAMARPRSLSPVSRPRSISPCKQDLSAQHRSTSTKSTSPKYDENFKQTAKIYGQAPLRTTSSSQTPKATTITPSAVGLRGILPNIDRETTGMGAATTDPIRFKLTHSGYLTSRKLVTGRQQQVNSDVDNKAMKRVPLEKRITLLPSSSLKITSKRDVTSKSASHIQVQTQGQGSSTRQSKVNRDIEGASGLSTKKEDKKLNPGSEQLQESAAGVESCQLPAKAITNKPTSRTRAKVTGSIKSTGKVSHKAGKNVRSAKRGRRSGSRMDQNPEEPSSVQESVQADDEVLEKREELPVKDLDTNKKERGN